MVQGHGQLDHAQTRAQVPAGHGHGVDGFGSHLVGELSQLGDAEATGVSGEGDGVEKRSVRHRPF